jgi:hypothetical protein
MVEDRSPFAARGFLFSAGLMAIVVLLAVALVLTGGGGGSAKRPSVVSAARPAGVDIRSGTPAADASECGLPTGSQAVPVAPAAAGWVLVGSMAAPNDPSTVGPGRTVDGFRECFAHSPLGALYSAVNFWAAGTAFSPARVYATLAADTPARAAVVRYSQGDNSRLSDSGQVELAGFQFDSYSASEADLSLVLQSTNGGLVTVACTMVWQAGDWRYEIPPSGVPATGQIQSLTGYVPWSDAS